MDPACNYVAMINDMNVDEIDWDIINGNLPCKKTPEETEKREQMFESFDPNGNGYLSLAEIDKGFNDMGEDMRIVYKSKNAMLLAFNTAKDFS